MFQKQFSRSFALFGIAAFVLILALGAPGLVQAGPPSKPNTPTNMKAYVIGSKSAYLTWTNNARDAKCIEIQKKPAGGDWRVIESCFSPKAKQEYVANDLVTGKSYTFKVKAKIDSSHSEWSNHATVATCNIAPPTGLTVKKKNNTLLVTFNDVNTCENGYFISITWPDKSVRSVFFSPGNSALPASALPASALPASALPASALPASALPASLTFSGRAAYFAIPSNSTFKFQTGGVVYTLPPGVSSPSSTVTVSP